MKKKKVNQKKYKFYMIKVILDYYLMQLKWKMIKKTINKMKKLLILALFAGLTQTIKSQTQDGMYAKINTTKGEILIDGIISPIIEVKNIYSSEIGGDKLEILCND